LREGVLAMITLDEREALERLIEIAKSDTGQSARVANFLLAWWNATRDGGFDLIDLWHLDQQIKDDMVAIFAVVAREWHYPDVWGYQAEFEALVERWRRPKKRRVSR
jgi:hypothetical protein